MTEDFQELDTDSIGTHTETHERRVFYCPLHGLEAGFGCFRAYMPEHAGRWLCQRVTVETLGWLSEEEGRAHQQAELERKREKPFGDTGGSGGSCQ